MKPVLCLGDACADIVLPYGRAKSGQESFPEILPGGATANTAAGLGRLGIPCRFLGKAGDDYYGRLLRDAFSADGVDVGRFYLSRELPTALVLVVVDEDGDRLPFLTPRSRPTHLELYDEDLPDDLLNEISFVHTTGLQLFEEPSAGTVVRFLEKCHARRIPVSLDINLRVETVNRDTSMLRRAVELADYLLGSGPEEFTGLTGIGDPLEAAASLVRRTRTVVCRLGAAGSVAMDATGRYPCAAFPVEVADTLGAGDAFNSGFLWALCRGETLARANRAGCAAAAINLSRPGARNGPTAERLLSLLGV